MPAYTHTHTRTVRGGGTSKMASLSFLSGPILLTLPGRSRCLSARHRETGFVLYRKSFICKKTKAGQRWNFLCHSNRRGTCWPRRLTHTHQHSIPMCKKCTLICSQISPALLALNSQWACLISVLCATEQPLWKEPRANKLKASRKPQPTLLLSLIPSVTLSHAHTAPQIHTLQ